MSFLDPTGTGSNIAGLLSNPYVKRLLNGTPGASPRIAPTVRNTAQHLVDQVNQRNLMSQSATAGADPIAALWAQLVNDLQAPVAQPRAIDTEDLMKQVSNAINPIYDQQINSARDQTNRSTKDVQAMYGALAKDYERLAPQQIQQAQDAQEQVQQLYGQLRSNIEGSYSRVSKEQGDLFKQLGIEAALPSVLDQQDDSVNQALTAASENQAQQKQRYMDIGQMDSTYYREGAPNSELAGVNYSQELIDQLNDYVNKANAERSAAIQSGYMDQLGQAQSLQAQQQSTANSESARRQGMLWDMLQAQLAAQTKASSTTLTPDTFMSQLPQGIQSSVANAFTQLQRSPEVVYGKVEDKRNPVPGSFVDTTPEWLLSQADKMYSSGQIDATTHQALLMYIQLEYGMGNGK